jgi:hypothetical protein
MDHLKIEVLHRPRISIGRIGESDSNVQFVVAPFVSLTEKAVAWKFVPFISAAGYAMHVTVPSDRPEKSE